MVVLTREQGPQPLDLAPVADEAAIRFALSVHELKDALADADVLLVWDFRSAKLRDAWPNARRLKWAHVAGVGVEAVLFPELVSSSVILTNSRGVFDQAIAESVLGLMLAFAKGLPATLDLQRRHAWQHRVSERLAGQMALILGAGGIGHAIGRLARGAGMRVMGVARTARPADPDLGRVVGLRELEAVLPDADYVVIALPLTSETKGMVGARALGRMKPTARLVNVARGPIVDEEALVQALRAGRIAGAALDVFTEEPLPAESPLWDLPGVIVSPHMSGDFAGWEASLSQLFVVNFRRWRRGEPLLNIVDKRRGYVPTPLDSPPTGETAET